MKYLNYLSNGRVCSSMFAVPSKDDSNVAVCASFGNDQGSKCPVFKDNSRSLNKCKYTFNQEFASMTVPCDCSFMGGNQGRCPIPSNKTFQIYADKMKLLYDRMQFCHTSDRDNLLAYGECAPTNGTQDFDWRDAVTAKLDIEIYP